MTTEEKIKIKNFIEVVEEFKAPRVLVDYAFLLVGEFMPSEKYTEFRKEWDKFVEEEFRRYPIE